jgi:hypothetical protein
VHVLDDRLRQHDVEGARLERQRAAVGLQEREVRDALLGRQPRARIAEPIHEVDRVDVVGLLGERQRHAAAPAPGVEHLPRSARPAASQVSTLALRQYSNNA